MTQPTTAVDSADDPAFDAQAAAEYLGFGDARWMDDAPIAWCDVRKPGSSRPIKRWRRSTLNAFLAQREIQPGLGSPWGL